MAIILLASMWTRERDPSFQLTAALSSSFRARGKERENGHEAGGTLGPQSHLKPDDRNIERFEIMKL